MNFNVGGPSHFAYLSSYEDEVQLMADLEAIDAEQESINTQHGNIQHVIAQYLNQQNNQVTHEGSIPVDATDEYIKIRESTTIKSLKRFYRVIVKVFVEQYLKSPNANDVARLLRIGPTRF
ncbi:hypothetical protein Dsin_000233 [Dipteronia sinensis]|uniref:Uncharacterized protein n=1 Tax=Dipteronia sinensis TaxID=43782 RepID=A0AAE0EHV2_9ROSI|nr:hypothetical protein Dsin_000233 [Dipteronia sinensis]